MGSEEPDVWPRTVEISFGKVEVTRHEFYECFEPQGVAASAFDAVVRCPGRTVCIYRVGFKTDEDHRAFLNAYSSRETVSINGKQVNIRVRDRTLNLIRVRVHQYKFSEDLGLLATRLRQYGSVTRIAWDTYQDRQLPKWCGIKTGVVNVDMEINENIPSYINFGSYRHQLMVEYAGQMKTCRLCDSQYHVSNTCPKLATTFKQTAYQATTPRSTISIGGVQNKATTSGWHTRKGGRTVPSVEQNMPREIAQVDEAPVPQAIPSSSIPAPNESFVDAVVEIEGNNGAEMNVAKKQKRKKSVGASKELRDQERQEKRGERRGSQDPPPEKSALRPPDEQGRPLLLEEGPTGLVVKNPAPVAGTSGGLAEAVDGSADGPMAERSNPAEVTLPLVEDEPDITAGQRPRDTQPPPTNESCPLGIDISSQSILKNDIESLTIAAMAAYREQKQKSKLSSNKNRQLDD